RDAGAADLRRLRLPGRLPRPPDGQHLASEALRAALRDAARLGGADRRLPELGRAARRVPPLRGAPGGAVPDPDPPDRGRAEARPVRRPGELLLPGRAPLDE